jgi:hypothetical protein
MRHLKSVIVLALCTLTLNSVGAAQQAATTSVPNLIRYSGTLKDAQGVAPVAVGVTFAIYKQQDGGAPVWMETQNVTPDVAGQYSVVLGSTTAGGLPDDLFSQQEQRWLGVQVEGQAEQPRVLLVSVPYAFRAHEAETLGGLPASAFMPANPSGLPATAAKALLNAGASRSQAEGANAPTQSPITGSGTKNFIPIWTNSDTLGNSALFQAGSNVGLGTTTPEAKLDVVAIPANANSVGGIRGTGANSGLSGHATATSGFTSGVSGRADSVNGTGVYGQSVNWVGVGGMATATSGSPAYGVWGDSLSSNGVGVAGFADATSGNTSGVAGNSASISGNGVSGYAVAPSGYTNGVYGSSSSPNGAGINGYASATTGYTSGVFGASASNTGSGVNGAATAPSGYTNGVYGSSSSPNGAGINGYASATTGYTSGVFGASASNTGSGVNGAATATSGYTNGVYGQSASTSGTGVSGNATAPSGYTNGVYGSTASDNGNGVFGIATNSAATGNANGVFGRTNSTGFGAGVHGEANAGTGPAYDVFGAANSPNGVAVFGGASAAYGNPVGVVGSVESPGGIAGQFVALAGAGLVLQGLSGSSFTQVFTVDASGNGYFGGNLNVTGNLTKGSGSFKIDHPLDPENKYLSHSFVESPDMMDVYNGNVTTDKRGLAMVSLPDYFQALNRDFRYQLTVIGQFAQAIIIKEIKDNSFTIKTNKPSVKVSWQVTGIRQDAYANIHRIPVEEQKAKLERGKYLHPEVFAVGRDKSISAQLQ